MINTETKICVIIGNPVEHSLSPLIHNAGYQKLGLNFLYMVFRIRDIRAAINSIRTLGILGVSVTAPYKTLVTQFLDKIDKNALKIGAVNTILNKKGKLFGFNTDIDGAIKAISERVPNLKGKKAVLIGAGGVGRAIAYGLKEKGANLLVLDKISSKARDLAVSLSGSDFGKMERLPEILRADILINATPVGMFPNAKKSAVPKKYLRKNLAVFDIVYNPKHTKLLLDAKKVGCKIIFGHKMFLYQAAKQFEIFTNHKAPIRIMEKALCGTLEKQICHY